MKGSIEKTDLARCRWTLPVIDPAPVRLDFGYILFGSCVGDTSMYAGVMRIIAPSARQDHALLEPACASALMVRISRSLSFSAATTGSDSDSAFRGAADVTTPGTAS